MQMVVLDDESELEVLRRELQAAKVQIYNQKRRIARLENTLEKERTDKDTQLALVTNSFRKGTGMSSGSGFRIAIQRNLANVASFAMSCAVGFDIHRNPITNYELNVRAAQISSMWAFHAECKREIANQWNDLYKRLDNSTPTQARQTQNQTRTATYSFSAIRGDATNARVWQHCKLHSTEVLSGFSAESGGGLARPG